MLKIQIRNFKFTSIPSLTKECGLISEATNVYARSKRVTPTGNRCTDPTHDEYRKHCRLNTWIDVSPGDIKLFMAHILII